MALPAARTRDEAHLYMDMHPCDRCGGVDVEWESSLTEDGGVPVRRYRGACGECEASREFVFALPERPVAPDANALVFFGGAEPSLLFDPGEWLLVADLCAQAAGADQESIAVAAAAVDEILKFVPGGANVVPESAFWSTRGRTVYRQEPGRFERRRLLVVRDAYREALK